MNGYGENDVVAERHKKRSRQLLDSEIIAKQWTNTT
jgi:hypothetical protein